MSIKKICRKDEIENPPDDEIVFYLTFDPDLTEIVLMAKCSSKMTPKEYMDALNQFVNDASEFPDRLFIEDITEDFH